MERMASASSIRLVGVCPSSNEDAQATARPSPVRPWEPPTRRAFVLMPGGGQPKNSSQGSNPGLLWMSTWVA